MSASPNVKTAERTLLPLRRLATGIVLALCCLAVSATAFGAAGDRTAQEPPPTPAPPLLATLAAEEEPAPDGVLPPPTPTIAAGELPPPPDPAAQPSEQMAAAEPGLPEGMLPAVSGSYFTDFGPYTLAQKPNDWTWSIRGSGLMVPTVILYGGGNTDAFKRLEFITQNANVESWLVKNSVYYGPARRVDAIVNFQTNGPGLAGVVVGWKDKNNFAAVLLDQNNDTVWILVYQNGVPTWQNNGYGATSIAPNVDYLLRANIPTVGARGSGYIEAWLGIAGGAMSHLFTSTNPVDLRGRTGVGAGKGEQRVVFDNFRAIGESLPEPAANWTAPEGNGATWDVYGDSIRMAFTVTNDIAVRYVHAVRYNANSGQWSTVMDFDGPPPYSYDFGTGVLNFGLTEFAIDVYTIDNRVLRGPSLWLNRLRTPNTVAVLSANPRLTANGQSNAQVVLELRDRGGNLLPQVPVSFGGQKVTIAPQTAATGASGRVTVTVTAGTVAGAGKVLYATGVLQGEIPVTLVAGPAAALPLALAKTQLVADGAASTAVVATLVDAHNNPVAGANVTFGATQGTIGGSAVTNAQGKATVQYVAGVRAGTVQLTASHGSLTTNTAVQLVAGAPAQLAITGRPAFLYADGASSGEVRARLQDAHQNPVAGRSVQFTTNRGRINAGATTNAQGEAVASLTAGSDVGTARVEVKFGALTAAAGVSMVAGPTALVQLQLGPREIVVADTEEVSIAIVARDAANRPLAGAMAYFSTTLGSITPSAVTDATGVATAVLRHNQAIGRALVTASVEAVSIQTEIVFKPWASSLYLAIVRQDEPQPVLVNGFFDAGEAQGWTQLVNGQARKLIYRFGEKPAIPQPVSPPYVAWLGGADSEVNQLHQSVTLPKSYVVSLEYGYYTESGELTCGRDTAVLEAIAGSDRWMLQDIALCYPQQTASWRRAVADLSPWRGQFVLLQFRSVLNNDIRSNLFVDNVRLCSSDPAAPPSLPACGGQ